MTIEGRVLGPPDMAALDEVLAVAGLPGAFARSRLIERGPGDGGLFAYGWPGGERLAAALVAVEAVCWTVWRDPACLPALARLVSDRAGDLLSCERSHVEPVLDLLPDSVWRDQDRCPLEVLTPEGYSSPSVHPDLAPRLATADDVEPLITFYLRGFYSLARLPGRAAWRQRLVPQIARRSMTIVERNGLVRAAAMSSAETPELAILGGVATLDEYRNRGYSTAVVGALCEHLFRQGKRQVALFYMPGNAPAARVYAKLGFERRGEWWLTRLAR